LGKRTTSGSDLSTQQTLHKQPTSYSKERAQKYAMSDDEDDDDNPDLQTGIQQSLQYLDGNPPSAPIDKLPNLNCWT